jgi:hypothetical protein
VWKTRFIKFVSSELQAPGYSVATDALQRVVETSHKVVTSPLGVAVLNGYAMFTQRESVRRSDFSC